MSARVFAGALVLAGLSLGACATALSCTPVFIVVTAKERRTRVDLDAGTPLGTETGRVRQAPRESFIPEYWLRDGQGRWYQVSEATWRTAETGQRVEVCR